MFCDKYKQRLSPSEGKESWVPVQLKGREFRETAPHRHQKNKLLLSPFVKGQRRCLSSITRLHERLASLETPSFMSEGNRFCDTGRQTRLVLSELACVA